MITKNHTACWSRTSLKILLIISLLDAQAVAAWPGHTGGSDLSSSAQSQTPIMDPSTPDAHPEPASDDDSLPSAKTVGLAAAAGAAGLVGIGTLVAAGAVKSSRNYDNRKNLLGLTAAEQKELNDYNKTQKSHQKGNPLSTTDRARLEELNKFAKTEASRVLTPPASFSPDQRADYERLTGLTEEQLKKKIVLERKQKVGADALEVEKGKYKNSRYVQLKEETKLLPAEQKKLNKYNQKHADHMKDNPLSIENKKELDSFNKKLVKPNQLWSTKQKNKYTELSGLTVKQGQNKAALEQKMKAGEARLADLKQRYGKESRYLRFGKKIRRLVGDKSSSKKAGK